MNKIVYLKQLLVGPNDNVTKDSILLVVSQYLIHKLIQKTIPLNTKDYKNKLSWMLQTEISQTIKYQKIPTNLNLDDF